MRKQPIHRPSTNEKLQKLADKAMQTFLESDKIQDFVDLVENVEKKMSTFRLNNNPIIVKNTNDIFIINMILDSSPLVQSSTSGYEYEMIILKLGSESL